MRMHIGRVLPLFALSIISLSTFQDQHVDLSEIIQAAQHRVPEPTGLALAIVGCFFLLRGRSPRRSPGVLE